MKPLRLPASLDALEPIGKFVVEATTTAGLDARAAYNLRLAVDEIATNIITHGYEEAGLTGDLTVSGELSDLALTIVLEDSGVPFDPLNQRLPDEEELSLPLEERSIGGLGIFLVLKGVDTFRYERVNEHNRNIFVMQLPGKE
jgi:anti-sigma regulatory factor (Ser/Thr protein kinase)